MKDSCFQQPLLLLANNSFNFNLRAGINLESMLYARSILSYLNVPAPPTKLRTQSPFYWFYARIAFQVSVPICTFLAQTALQYLGNISYQSEKMHLDRPAVLETRFSITRKKPITQVPTSIVPKWPKMPVKTRRVKQLLRYYQSWYYQRLNRPEY